MHDHVDIYMGKIIKKLLHKESYNLQNYKESEKNYGLRITSPTPQVQLVAMVSTSKKSFDNKRKYTKLIESVDKILNVIIDKDLIETPPIVKHHF